MMRRALLSIIVVATVSFSYVEAFVPLGRTQLCLHQRVFSSNDRLSRLSQDTAASEVEDVDDPSLTAVAQVAPPVEEPQKLSKRRVARIAIPISVALTIGTFSLLEILESVRELAKHKVGHAHGISVLALLRLGRSATLFKVIRHKGSVVRTTHQMVRFKSKAVVHIAKGVGALQTQSEELEEYVSELEHEICSQQLPEHVSIEKRSVRYVLTSFVTSPRVSVTAAFLAVIACVAEIVDDIKPGAHHGAALLAMSEMYYQFRRLKARIKKDLNRTSRWRTSTRIGKLWSKTPVGPTIAIAAAIYAGIEVVEDLSPGAHHGVAILAMAELVENINRSRVVNQFENRLSGAMA